MLKRGEEGEAGEGAGPGQGFPTACDARGALGLTRAQAAVPALHEHRRRRRVHAGVARLLAPLGCGSGPLRRRRQRRWRRDRVWFAVECRVRRCVM
jgi:hypothetical protein